MADEEQPEPDDITRFRPVDPPSPPPSPPQPSPYVPPPVAGQAYQPYGAPPGPPPVGFGLTPGVKVPGQIDPETHLPYSDKERVTAGLLQLIPSVMGIPGIGRLYTGHTAIGLIQLIGAVSGWLFTCILIGLLWAVPLWIWGVIDGILMLTNKRFTDAQGRVLR